MPPLEDPTGAATATLADTEARDGAHFTLAPGTLLGRYVIVDQLGAGGMGAVYVGYDTQLARRVAIKVLRPGASADGGANGNAAPTSSSPDAQARLLLEAQTMARLTHPNVATVHDVGTFGDGVFIAMEYIEGHTLSSWLREPHPWREALAVLGAAGRGLEAAHAAGVVHRDFKPANVFLGHDGRVVVGDFGIARASVEQEIPSARSLPDLPLPTPSTRALADEDTGAIVGTIGYMSPERAFDHRDDARSDQFSFCVTLYRALYGQPPFPHFNLDSYLSSLLQPPRPPPAGTRVPAWVHAVVVRGLSYEPSDRFPSMTELLSALERDPTRRRRTWALAACGALLAGAAGVAWIQHQRSVRAECRVGESLIAATWGPEARAKVGARITTTGAPLAAEFAERTQKLLDAYAREWARVHREASEATLLRGEQSTRTMKDRLACLDGEREELGALVDVLSRADPAVAMRAIGAAYDLPTPRSCLEPSAAAAALPDTPGPRARVSALRRTVAEAEALRMTAKWDDALDVATGALVEARAIPHRQSEAELLYLMAACERETKGDAVALETFEQAFAASEAAGNDSLSAIGAATIAFELGDSLSQPRESERWLAIAKGIREREGTDERADAEILEAELSLLSSSGHQDKSLPLQNRLLALLERIYGPSHPRVAATISNRAGDFDANGQPDRAVVEYQRALAMQERLFGDDTPYLSIVLNNIGSVMTEVGRYGEAKQALERALSLVAPLGADNPHNVLPLVTLAQLDGRIGDHEGELAAADRGIAIVAATGESEIRFLPALLLTRGNALLAKGDAAGAREACGKALRMQEELQIVAPDKEYDSDTLTCMGDAEVALGQLDDAIASLERSVSIVRRFPATDLALARFALARALTAAKRDPARARDLAESAQRDLRAVAWMGREASDVAQWLELHPR
jgi:tetratricopeptide (TPR) repeat protein